MSVGRISQWTNIVWNKLLPTEAWYSVPLAFCQSTPKHLLIRVRAVDVGFTVLATLIRLPDSVINRYNFGIKFVTNVYEDGCEKLKTVSALDGGR
jgi:hypothetical protein